MLKKVNKKSKSFLRNKFFLIGSTICLLFFWFFASVFFNRQISFSTLRYGYDYKPIYLGKLLKNERITGEFKSKDNYMGIIFLRFDDVPKQDYYGEDTIRFKIKEKSRNNWYYVNDYRTGLLQTSLLFPFGFPVIWDSKNKDYIFEIESLNGNSQNSVKLSSSAPVLITAHQFPKKEIFGSKKRIIKYLFLKSINSLTSIDFILNSVIFAIPLVLFIIYTLFESKVKIGNQSAILIILLIILDIILFKTVYLGIESVLLSAWLFVCMKNKLSSNINISIGTFLVLMWVILTVLKIDSYDSKLNFWTFTFFAIGIFELIVEIKLNSRISENNKFFIKNKHE